MLHVLFDVFLNLGLWWLKAWVSYRLLKFSYIFVMSIYGHFLSRPLDLSPYKDKWTVVTGCTDGIGKAYIDELCAARGIRKLFLIARNEKKLDKIVKDLKERFDCEIKTAIFDFEKDDVNNLPNELQELEVGILINCVGIAPELVANFIEQPPGLPSKIMKVNLMSNLRMTELILPGMLKRDCGIIVNMASMTGWRPLPYMCTYPASKAAISFYSDCLADEFAHTNVKIQCLIPLLVATKIASYETTEANDIFVVDPKTFAKYAVNIIGRFRLSTGCFAHDMQVAFGTMISFWVFKQLFVPFVMLGVHKKRVREYQERYANKIE
ncbi:Dhs-27 [Aphelenchoides besseyi]|nr:Dhs-27 [Aphelenchoides besseyi]KAI6201526.1 Dhs-27 [Aphelenchoides besseyi]